MVHDGRGDVAEGVADVAVEQGRAEQERDERERGTAGDDHRKLRGEELAGQAAAEGARAHVPGPIR